MLTGYNSLILFWHFVGFVVYLVDELRDKTEKHSPTSQTSVGIAQIPKEQKVKIKWDLHNKLFLSQNMYNQKLRRQQNQRKKQRPTI